MEPTVFVVRTLLFGKKNFKVGLPLFHHECKSPHLEVWEFITDRKISL